MGKAPRSAMDQIAETASDATLDTLPKRLAARARASADRVFLREKDLGIWQSWTWRAAHAEARELACGLAARGFARGGQGCHRRR